MQSQSPFTMLSMRALSYHFFVWKVCGLWPDHPRPQRGLYFYYSISIIILFYVAFPLFIAIELLHANGISDLTDILLILPTTFVGIKGALIWRNTPKLRRLFALLGRMDASIRNEAQRQRIERELLGCRRLVVFFSSEFYVSVLSHFTVALLADGRQLMWPSYYPLDYVHVNGYYYGLLGYQLVSSIMCAFMTSSMDVYGLALYKLLGAHVDILGEQLGELGDQRSTGNYTKLSYQQSCEADLRHCITYHQLCISYSHCLNDIVSAHYFMQLGMSGIIICGSEFKLISLNPFDDVTHYTLAVLYIIGMIFEILLPCYYGSEVRTKSEQLGPSVFRSNWLEQSQRFRSAMVIFTERTKRSIAPFAGGMFALALPTFVSTMKFAYSLLALLKNIEGKEN